MKFRVLGPMAVEGPRGQPVDLKGLRQRAVLAVLLIEARRVVHSDYLAELVWDGEPPPQAAGTLQSYISRLRRLLEPDQDGKGRPWQVLRTVGAGYCLDVPAEAVDSTEFEELCRAEEGCSPDDSLALLDRALALWRGEPYAEFRFFNFARSECNRLEERRWWAVERRAEVLLASGRHLEVVADLAGQLPLAPYRERMRSLLMLALYRSGRQADALACYQEGRRLLVEDLGVDPGSELRRMEQAIIVQDPALDLSLPPAQTGEPPRPASAMQGRPPMFGRASEEARAGSFIDQLRGGRGGLLLLRGEAGIGKTRLAEEAAKDAAERGVEVRWGRCPEMEGAPPFWPWIQILRDLFDAEEIPAALKIGAVGGDFLPADHTGFLLYESIRVLLERRTQEHGPLLLVLEDLHWADHASLRLLRHLCGSAAPCPGFGIIATTRPEHRVPVLSDLESDAARSATMTVLDLKRLDRRAAQEFVLALSREEVAPRVLDAVIDRSGGNPFFITELVRLGAAGAGGVPRGVSDVIQQRASGLTEGTRALLAAAACSPGSFDLGVLARALGEPVTAVLDRSDEALAARLIREVADRPGSMEFSHPLVRDAIAAQMSHARRAHLHLKLAEVLQSQWGSSPDDETVAAIAHHCSEAGSLAPVDDLLRWSIEAARRELGRSAAEDARDRVVRALEVARASGSENRSRVVELLILLGRADRALGTDNGSAAIYEAMDLARSLEDAPQVVEAARAMASDAWGFTITFGRPETRLVDHLAWALPRLEGAAPADWVSAASFIAAELVFGEDPGQAGLLAEKALERARQQGDDGTLLTALHARWLAIWGPESLCERTELVHEMELVVRRAGLHPARTFLLRWATALEQADPDSAQLVLTEVEERVARGRDAALTALLAWRRSLRAILDGRFDEAEKLIHEAYVENSRFNAHEAFDAYSGQTALLHYLSGRFGELVPILEQAISEQPYLRSAFGPPLALALTDSGRADEARHFLRSLGVGQLDRPPQAMLRSGTTSTLAVCCARLGDPDLAEAALRLLGDDSLSPAVVDQVGVFYNGARAAHRGRLLTVLGRFDEAVSSLERGLDVDLRVQAAVFVNRDRIDLAEALLGRGGPGDRERATELAAQAEADAERMGLEHDARCAGELARRGRG